MTDRITHYELGRLLGRGGMGEVYEAIDLKTRRSVALKFLAPELAADPAALRRFESEAVNAAALNHPNIATLYAFEPEAARPFIAMELVRGPTLRERLSGGPLPIAETLAIGRDVAAALAYAHRRGIVHRDIKPENLMFDEEGRVKIMDFGLARALESSRITTTGTHMGTPAYLSPEALRGGAGTAGDVFALGLVIHEMLTGKTVYQADTALAVMYAIANVDPPPLRAGLPDAPEEVEQLLQRMLDKDPATRADASAAARELARLTGAPLPIDSGAGAGARPRDTRRAVDGATPSGASSDEARVTRRRSRRRVAWMAGAAVLVIVVAGVLRWVAAGRARNEALLLNNEAYAALRSGDLDRAQELVTRALGRDPRYPEALFNRAVIVDRRGHSDSAAALYQTLLRRRSTPPVLTAMVLYNLGDLDLRLGATAQAVDHFQRSFQLDSSRWEVYNNLGYAWTRARRPAEAIPLLERGIARFPGAAPLHKNAGLAWFTMERDSQALVCLDRALTRDPGLLEAFGLRARARARLGDQVGAREDWQIYSRASPPPDPRERELILRELVQRGVLPHPDARPNAGGLRPGA